MTVYVENSQGICKKLLEVIGDSSKITGHKINVQQLIVFLSKNNEHVKTKLKIQCYLQLLKNGMFGYKSNKSYTGLIC